jgi:hypothetical protein
MNNKILEASAAIYSLDENQASEAVVDSAMSYEEAVLNGLPAGCPEEILARQVVLEVYHWGFDDKIHRGQIVVDERVAKEVQEVFTVAFETKFKIRSVIPISKFGWNDDASMDVDNTSAFNFRTIAHTNILSKHSKGLAVDINPRLNPHYRMDGEIVPPNAIYEAGKAGVLVEGDPIVSTFKKHGWKWGGNWKDEKDWQHFDKILE